MFTFCNENISTASRLNLITVSSKNSIKDLGNSYDSLSPLWSNVWYTWRVAPTTNQILDSRSCDVDNGLCDHYCSRDLQRLVSCECKLDFQLVEDRMCLPRDLTFEPIATHVHQNSGILADNATNQQQQQQRSLFDPPLFSLSRDCKYSIKKIGRFRSTTHFYMFD